MLWRILALVVAGLMVAGCGQRTLRVDFVPVEERLTPQVIESADAGTFTRDKIAMISISGLNGTARSLAVYASQGELPHRHARLASGWLASLSWRD